MSNDNRPNAVWRRSTFAFQQEEFPALSPAAAPDQPSRRQRAGEAVELAAAAAMSYGPGVQFIDAAAGDAAGATVEQDRSENPGGGTNASCSTFHNLALGHSNGN